MTGKRALRKLYFDNKNLNVEISLNDMRVCEIYNIIKYDLERLEILQQFYKLCLTKYVPLDSLSPNFCESKEEWLEVMSYDYYIFLCEDVCEYVVKENIRLTSEEFNFIYKLLKEELENE